MTDKDVQIRLGIFFTTINITALFLAGLAAIYVNFLAAAVVFFTIVMVSAFLVERKAWHKLEERENDSAKGERKNKLFNI